MGLEALRVLVMEGLHRRALDGAVHAFGWAVGPWMAGFGQAVLDTVLCADAVEDMAEAHGGWACAILRQIGKGHAIVGQHRVDLIREGLDDAAQEGCTVHFPRLLVEFHIRAANKTYR